MKHVVSRAKRLEIRLESGALVLVAHDHAVTVRLFYPSGAERLIAEYEPWLLRFALLHPAADGRIFLSHRPSDGGARQEAIEIDQPLIDDAVAWLADMYYAKELEAS